MMPQREQLQFSDCYTFPRMLVYHEMNMHDRHRLRIVSQLYREEGGITSAWYGYDDIAYVEYGARMYYATTEYYEGMFPRVFIAEAGHGCKL